MRTLELSSAKKAKKDEFYTQREDIERELIHYTQHFKGKVVLCPCDDPRESEFFKYFVDNFSSLGLKRLIATCYKPHGVDLFSWEKSERAICQVYDSTLSENREKNGLASGAYYLKGSGDFRSAECVEILKQADIIVTNPPFSLFRDFIALLMKHKKQFLVIGNVNAITYKDIFPYIQRNEIWLGVSIHGGDRKFRVPDNYDLNAAGCGIDKNGKKFIRVKGVRWWTNMDHSQRHELLPLIKEYTPTEFPKYDNFDAIEIGKTADIPYGYDGIMGVPITFLDKYNNEQFEIIGNEYSLGLEHGRCYINGKRSYSRIFIKARKRKEEQKIQQGEAI